jgi:hypothetical protein
MSNKEEEAKEEEAEEEEVKEEKAKEEEAKVQVKLRKDKDTDKLANKLEKKVNIC